ncbi:flavin reductase family protein [Flavobacterium sp. KJJ]|uniref:flavin reductase family protein n=1 Tax=Flavobacterium sp. KJJ TaxID=1270193 RepID=UPI0004935A94|nr:flavin reductase [Flavobacterium sp. KJJ]
MKKILNFTSSDLQKMEKQTAVHLINSVGGFKSVALVGTSDLEGNTNLSIFSSFFHIGANPPLIGMIFRPSPPERDTMRNIINSGFYTINHINENIYRQSHQTSARYSREISEFEVAGLSKEYKNNFFAPFVLESNVQLGIEFKEKIDIQINNTTMVIGEIVQVFIPEDCLSEDGFVNLEKANTVTCSGLDSYHKTIQLDRLSYAKPNMEITSLIKN